MGNSALPTSHEAIVDCMMRKMKELCSTLSMSPLEAVLQTYLQPKHAAGLGLRRLQSFQSLEDTITQKLTPVCVIMNLPRTVATPSTSGETQEPKFLLKTKALASDWKNTAAFSQQYSVVLFGKQVVSVAGAHESGDGEEFFWFKNCRGENVGQRDN